MILMITTFLALPLSGGVLFFRKSREQELSLHVPREAHRRYKKLYPRTLNPNLHAEDSGPRTLAASHQFMSFILPSTTCTAILFFPLSGLLFFP